MTKNFCETNCLKSLITEPTCFKSHGKPNCIDLKFTNRPNLVQHNNASETGFFSDFRVLTITEYKMGFQKLKTKIIAYRDYKDFDNAKVRFDIVTATSNVADFGTYKITTPKEISQNDS